MSRCELCALNLFKSSLFRIPNSFFLGFVDMRTLIKGKSLGFLKHIFMNLKQKLKLYYIESFILSSQ